jgi:hypothetical protein
VYTYCMTGDDRQARQHAVLADAAHRCTVPQYKTAPGMLQTATTCSYQMTHLCDITKPWSKALLAKHWMA